MRLMCLETFAPERQLYLAVSEPVWADEMTGFRLDMTN
jgi:hypothetical protein